MRGEGVELLALDWKIPEDLGVKLGEVGGEGPTLQDKVLEESRGARLWVCN